MLSAVGANVTLPCLQWQPEPNGTVSWKLENQAVSSERAVLGASLLLRLVQDSDSGRYSCYVGGCLVHSLRLLVEGESGSGRGCLRQRPGGCPDPRAPGLRGPHACRMLQQRPGCQTPPAASKGGTGRVPGWRGWPPFCPLPSSAAGSPCSQSRGSPHRCSSDSRAPGAAWFLLLPEEPRQGRPVRVAATEEAVTPDQGRAVGEEVVRGLGELGRGRGAP